MSDTLVRVEGLSKKFCLSLKRSLWYGLQDLGRELAGRRHGGDGELRPQEFWAVKDIHFELKRGECLGLIGHNGAGKTTLLRMLNGLIKPDAGRAELRGRVGALIALGAGFNPVLTGRENIYINAAVLGMSKRHVDSKLDEIIDFAEIGPFLDTPVRNYSSGMNVRLGFSIAAILLRPDVLLLDEVLAVGDVGFVIKCLNELRRLSQEAAVVLVSHNMQYVSSFCTRVLVMDAGRIDVDALDPSSGIGRYYDMSRTNEHSTGAGGAELEALSLTADGVALEGISSSIFPGTLLQVGLRVRITAQDRRAAPIFYLFDESMSPIICVPLCSERERLLELEPGVHDLQFSLGAIDLNAGRYSCTVAIRDAESLVVLRRIEGLCPFRVNAKGTYWGKVVRPVVVRRSREGVQVGPGGLR